LCEWVSALWDSLALLAIGAAVLAAVHLGGRSRAANNS